MRNIHSFQYLWQHTQSESLVINRMLNSFVALSYPDDRFEIIVVDDSTDDTYQKIQTRLPDLQGLKVIHKAGQDGKDEHQILP